MPTFGHSDFSFSVDIQSPPWVTFGIKRFA
jgi:hypothetical protein